MTDQEPQGIPFGISEFPVSDPARGELVLTLLGQGTRLRVEQADPRILISGPLVRQALGAGPGWLRPGCELSSDRLVIEAENGRLVYRIGAYLPELDCYEAEWPD
jgi:hypothetical protein